ncbi:hypothetical protein [Pelagicoccus sp. SDUM812003]|uniref:hypothetical protein n=1 Tax=Pelagicoccus sp. SDUM812003 TaxID=3041267 RepID=UPI00280CB06F|nr:hypothetical protein [Pelagicoccus sp. SDUM812003]MDQ8205190.1 hypothetical protein [Pelagicoccus sp. SDUM812003]
MITSTEALSRHWCEANTSENAKVALWIEDSYRDAAQATRSTMGFLIPLPPDILLA